MYLCISEDDEKHGATNAQRGDIVRQHNLQTSPFHKLILKVRMFRLWIVIIRSYFSLLVVFAYSFLHLLNKSMQL